ncbi:MAG: C-GCAxxG-C-C family protein [Spirochaetales bacterium]|nr:C-GCAxxG-C-C family protein [Spirochaetales bacterium]
MKTEELKLSKIIESGLDKKEDLNCSETILKAANISYNMKLDKTALKLAAGFGGGMGIESTCGALTGAVMVLSHLFVTERGHESDYIRDLTREFLYIFEDEMKSIDCSFLKDKYRDPETDCRPIIHEAALLLEKIIKRELGK